MAGSSKKNTARGKSRELTVKQTKFVKAYVANDGNGQHAAMEAYDTTDENTARSIASENLTKPNVKAAIEVALKKYDITLDSAVRPIRDGLAADHEFYDSNGEQHTRPDHSTRLRASAMALKLLGAEEGDSKGPGVVNFNFNKTTYVHNEQQG